MYEMVTALFYGMFANFSSMVALVGHGNFSLFSKVGRTFIMEGRMGARLVQGTSPMPVYPISR